MRAGLFRFTRRMTGLFERRRGEIVQSLRAPNCGFIHPASPFGELNRRDLPLRKGQAAKRGIGSRRSRGSTAECLFPKGSPHDRSFPLDCRHCGRFPDRRHSGHGPVLAARGGCQCDRPRPARWRRAIEFRHRPDVRQQASERGRNSFSPSLPAALQRSAGQEEASRQHIPGQWLRIRQESCSVRRPPAERLRVDSTLNPPAPSQGREAAPAA
jgi:hypothetical protein